MARVTTALQTPWRAAAMTDVGKVRSHNEDSHAVLEAGQLGGAFDIAVIVADGMGGRNAGEVASRCAVEAVSQVLSSSPAYADPVAALRSAVETAHWRIQQWAEANVQYEGMGTTLLVALAKGEQLWIASVGDSRAYLLRDEQLVPLTEDHTFVAEQVRAGGMSREQARHSRFRHMLTRAVGTSADYTPDIHSYRLRQGDLILLCTDGLTNMLPEETIQRALRSRRQDLPSACRLLIDLANAQGGEDNITVALAAYRDGETLDEEPEMSTVHNLPLLSRKSWGFLRRLPTRYLLVAGGVAVGVALAAWWGLPRPKPSPVAQVEQPPPPVDLASVRYSAPQTLLNKPLRGAPLSISPDGSLYAMTEQGRILRVAADGRVLAVSERPFVDAASSESKPDVIYFATDWQGNLYVVDRTNRRILKYRSDGQLLGSIGEGALQRPAAVAVAADGSVYVVDAGKLKVFRVKREESGNAPEPNR